MSSITSLGNECSIFCFMCQCNEDYDRKNRNNGGVTPHLIKNVFRNISTQTAIWVYLKNQLKNWPK